ncbi:MAG: hypothetical protein HY718_20925, partial [Planctomycetes bacterium]|nr:hypothetical protein [Planctomycetota bacterium]
IAGTPVVAVSAEGWISRFRQETRFEFADGRLRNARAFTRELRGEMEITWAAARQADDFISTEFTVLEIPVSIPILVSAGPVPMTVWLKASARVSPQLRFNNMSSRGSLKVVYGSNHGLRIEDETFSPLDGTRSANFSVTGETVSAGPVTVGFGAGFEFPRVELTVLGVATAFVSMHTGVAGFYEPGLLSGAQPCQWAEMTIQAITGYDMSILGVTFLSDSHELWRQETKHYAGGEPCD